MGIENKKSRVALVNPNSGGNYVCKQLNRESLGLGYLSSFLSQQGLETEIFDARLSRWTADETVAEIEEFDPKIIGISLIAKESTEWAEQLSRLVKSHDERRVIVLGNYFPSLQPENALKSVSSSDFVVLGEGEESFLELSNILVHGKDTSSVKGIAGRNKNGLYVNQRRPLITNLTSLPFPTRYASEEQVEELAVEGSRGCFSSCTFCAINPHFGAEKTSQKWRKRDIVGIATEIELLLKKYPNIHTFRFIDADFIGQAGNLERLKEFTDAMQQLSSNIQFFIDAQSHQVVRIPEKIWRGLKSAGLVQVYLGVETGVERIKTAMRKSSKTEDDQIAIELLNRLGIDVQYGFMMITPWTEEEDFKQNLDFLYQVGFARLDKFFQEMNLVPGTAAMEIVGKEKNIFPDSDTGYFSYEVPEAVEKVRVGNRILVADHCNFLERFFFLHQRLRDKEIKRGERVEMLRQDFKDINYAFFLEFLNACQSCDTHDIQNQMSVLVEKFEPVLRELEVKFGSIL